jgi:hypothetical protein
MPLENPSSAFLKGNSPSLPFPASSPIVVKDFVSTSSPFDISDPNIVDLEQSMVGTNVTSFNCSFLSSDFSNFLQSYHRLLPIPSNNSNNCSINLPVFENYLNSLTPRFKPGGVEVAAVSAAADFSWDDYSDLVSVMTPSSKIVDMLKAILEKSSSNQSRFTAASTFALSDDPNFDLLLAIGSEGAIIDVDPLFVKQSIPQSYRKLEKQMVKVFSHHAVKSARANRGLILRTDSIPSSELNKLHFNPQFWTYKPDDPLGRWLIDCSNRSDEALALNSGSSKQLVVNRYGAVSFPSVHSMILSWLFYMARKIVLARLLVGKKGCQILFPPVCIFSRLLSFISYSVGRQPHFHSHVRLLWVDRFPHGLGCYRQLFTAKMSYSLTLPRRFIL